MFKLNEILIYKIFTQFFKDKSKTIFWSFDPYRFVNPSLFKFYKTIYFAADLYRTEREKELIEDVDYVISVSKLILNEFDKDECQKILVSHGVSKISSSNIEKEKKAIIIATFSDRVDYVLLKKMVNLIPEGEFYLIGNDVITEDFNKCLFEEIISTENVKYLGAMRFGELDRYLKISKLGFLLAKTNRIHNQLNSLKIMQYLSYGISVVSTPILAYENTDLVYLTENYDDYIKQCKKILNSKDDNISVERRLQFAEKHLYSNLIKKIEVFFK
jgi:hypothetical protein